jgi:DMSO/TMAO reductase YedYZ molybdopterin-dependent catalytic subunit
MYQRSHKLLPAQFVAVIGFGGQLTAVAEVPVDKCEQTTSSGGYSALFRICGDVNKPAEFKLQDLQSLAQTTENVFFYTGKGPVQSEFTGVLLWDLLNSVGIKTNPTIKRDILRKVITVTGTDGYTVRISAGELDPSAGGEQVIVAYAQNGTILGPDSGFARLIFPGDKAGGRDVLWIDLIKVE